MLQTALCTRTVVSFFEGCISLTAFLIYRYTAADVQSAIPPLQSTVKQRWNGMNSAVCMSLDAEMSAEPLPDDCECIVVLRLWATHHDGGAP